ncbi:hypothetical protein C1701_01055 [Actinoalloteichus sp. AHMU CJ021]|uniref:hypothetical protein n=1 Tax=Actinoalloteichus TaxID=65496 RepID=UPI0004AB7FD6|nr:hypothetical protein [Actinoalloteichus caeruleus]AUS77183.1 hypothetical protein C1701_01055 [Actinoalloteichus sp. AHMU CJ021]
MTGTARRVVPVALGLVAFLCATSACTINGANTPPRSDEQEFSLDGQELTINAGNFDLRVVPAPGDAVNAKRSLTGMAAEEGNASWSLENGELRLTARCEGFSPGCGASFEVGVPAEANLSLISDAGGIRVVDVPNNLDIRNTNGTVNLNNVSGRLQVNGVAGAISGERLRSSEVNVRSENGSVRLGFTNPPDSVEAVARHSSVVVTLPTEHSYAITATSEYDRAEINLPHDPDSPRKVRAANLNGGAVVVQGA